MTGTPVLTGVQMLGNGVLQFAFTNIFGGVLYRAVHHQLVIPAEQVDGGRHSHEYFSRTVPVHLAANNDAHLFYRVRSPWGREIDKPFASLLEG